MDREPGAPSGSTVQPVPEGVVAVKTSLNDVDEIFSTVQACGSDFHSYYIIPSDTLNIVRELKSEKMLYYINNSSADNSSVLEPVPDQNSKPKTVLED